MRERAAGAAAVLTGGGAGTPVAARRWPWALVAAVAGAAVGAALALALRRLSGPRASGEQQPQELEAVVDLRDPEQSAP